MEVGHTYYGADHQRLIFVADHGDEVEVMQPMRSPETERMSRAAFDEFVAGGTRRTYKHFTGKVRTKIEDDGTTVVYTTPDGGHHRLSAKSWREWRKGAAA